MPLTSGNTLRATESHEHSPALPSAPSRRAVLGALAALPLAGCTPSTPAAASTTPLAGLAGFQRITLPSGRVYWLGGHTTGTQPRPVMIGLHGHGLDPANANATFWSAGGWGQHATEHGYALALGEGVGGTWNVGGSWTQHHGQDDVAYLALVAVDTTIRLPVSTRYVAGFSAGGAMAWSLLAARPDLVDAAGVVSGWASSYPTHPVDVWHCHGTADTTVPVRGGKGIFGVGFPPAAAEAARAPRGSRVVLYPHAGGHATPGWAAGAIWDFCTKTRALP